jgi:hypothetical protein
MAVRRAGCGVAPLGVVDASAMAGTGDGQLGDGVDVHGGVLSVGLLDHASDGKEGGLGVRPAMA